MDITCSARLREKHGIACVKFSTFVRIEGLSNNLKDFGLQKSLDNLDDVRQKLSAVSGRFAAFEAEALNVHVDHPLFQHLALPIASSKTRVPGIKIQDTRMIRLMEEIVHNGPLMTTTVSRPLAFLLVWTALGCFFGIRLALVGAYSGQLTGWHFPFWISLLEWWGWAVFALFAMALSRRLPLNSGRWFWALLIHIPLSLILSVIKMITDVKLFSAVFGTTPISSVYLGTTIERVFANILTYWSILAGIVGLDYYRKYRERQLRASHLETKLLEARLSALKMQLHPHFLFNTLNAVSALMQRDVDAAEHMLARLGELLRLTIDSGDVNEIRLSEEMEFLDRYLEIEGIRLGDRLRVEREVAPDALDAAAPTFILQPLVENAVRHGIAKSPDPGWIRIRAILHDDMLRIEIANSGSPLPAAFNTLKQGIGISNTKARLQELYGSRSNFTLRNADDAGVLAVLEIPYHRL